MKKHITTFGGLLLTCGQKKKRICEFLQEQEAHITDLNIAQVREKAKKSLDAMKEAIKIGLNSHEKSISNLCGDDCIKLQILFKTHCLIAIFLLTIPISVFIFSFILICLLSCSRESFLNSFSLLGTAIINSS